jgi:hypothetical protein
VDGARATRTDEVRRGKKESYRRLTGLPSGAVAGRGSRFDEAKAEE